MIKPWYDLKSGLSVELGKSLVHWSKNMHSHPGEYTADEWCALLYMHGSTLVRYGKQRYGKEDYPENYHVVEDSDSQLGWNLVPTADGFYVTEDEVAESEAKASLQWVTDHFHTLWD